MDIEDISKFPQEVIIEDDERIKIIIIIKELIENYNIEKYDKTTFIKKLDIIGRKNNIQPSLMKLLAVYRLISSTLDYPPEIKSNFELLLRTKSSRSLSGVVVITVFTSAYPNGQEFSCEYDCAYCPKEPNQPRSYLLQEPGVLRANRNKFDACDQMWDRGLSYIRMGHPLDKIELIISGGTFSSYPRSYIITYFRDLFYAANVMFDKITNSNLRERLSLEEEQNINQNLSLVKIIGITIETRPDRVTKKELQFLRYLEVTRVQIGVQHIDDRILNHINRKCNNIHTIRAIKLLKDHGFKVDMHIMPDLPHPDTITNEEMIELDAEMFNTIINDSDYQVDQIKVYPCATVPWTEIEKWYNEGTYKPYAETINKETGYSPLVENIIKYKTNVQPWIRINRIIRDIPNTYILGGNDNTGLRNDILEVMKKRDLKCKCIRCREVKGNKNIDLNDFSIIVRTYESSDGLEYFISYENKETTLLGFIRLRLNNNNFINAFPELENCALIRELHIYGQVLNHNVKNDMNSFQHIGLGKNLINKAIEISQEHSLNKIAVIAGTGVKNYYIKQGFEQNNGLGKYLIKNIKINKNKNKNFIIFMIVIRIIFILVSLYILFNL